MVKLVSDKKIRPLPAPLSHVSLQFTLRLTKLPHKVWTDLLKHHKLNKRLFTPD